jgi:hypothetical protein
MIGVDQIVGGVGEESMPLMRARPLGCRIRSGNELRRDRGGCAERRVVERGEIDSESRPSLHINQPRTFSTSGNGRELFHKGR